MRIFDRFKAAFSGEVVAAVDLSEWKDKCAALENELSEIEKLVSAREEHIKALAEEAKAAEEANKAELERVANEAEEAAKKAEKLGKSIEDAGLPKVEKESIEDKPKPTIKEAFAQAAKLGSAKERTEYLKGLGLL